MIAEAGGFERAQSKMLVEVFFIKRFELGIGGLSMKAQAAQQNNSEMNHLAHDRKCIDEGK
jgi:hypothetical protein